MQEREMTKSDKSKEKRLKKKYDDSDMKASMKKQYGDDWKNVYYATIRKKAMENMKEAEENSYTVVHAKHGKEVIKATSSYGAAKKYADMKKLKSTAGVDAHLMEAMKETEYAIIRYPDTAISYIKNDGSGWTHIYDKSYGFKGPVDKADLKYAKKIAKEKIPSRMMDEGYYKMPDIDRERYTEMPGLEGPFQTKSGKVVYYDPKEGAYYDRDTDMYMTYDEFKALDEGNSPHKKGTKKYKAHMAAMHANSVDLNSMRDALNLKEGNDSDVVAGYVRTMLNEKHDTWNKVTNEIDFVLGLLKEHNTDRQTVFNKLYSMNYKDNLDNNIVIKENIDTLRDIVNNKSAMTVKFQDGTMKVDMTTANIFLQAYDKMKESNQEKISEMMKTKKGFLRVLDFIYGAMK